MPTSRFRTICLFCFIISANFIVGEDYIVTDIRSIEKHPITDGTAIQTRGFIYQSKDLKWVLSSEANLKTCCVGSPGKSEKQIVLLGDFSEVSNQGVLTVRGIYRKPEGIAFLGVLEKAEVYGEADPSSIVVIGGLLAVSGIIGWSIWRKTYRSCHGTMSHKPNSN